MKVLLQAIDFYETSCIHMRDHGDFISKRSVGLEQRWGKTTVKSLWVQSFMYSLDYTSFVVLDPFSSIKTVPANYFSLRLPTKMELERLRKSLMTLEWI